MEVMIMVYSVSSNNSSVYATGCWQTNGDGDC